MVPDLATRFEHPDPLTYIVAVRPGVRFHDGRELTSADVAFTYRRFLDPAFVSGRKGAYKMIRAVEVVDRYTVRFTLNAPQGSFPINLVMGIVPEGTNSHTFEPQPSAAKNLETADIVFVNGLLLEDPTKELAVANLTKGSEICELGTATLPASQWIYDFSFPKDGGKPCRNCHLHSLCRVYDTGLTSSEEDETP